MFKLFGIWHQSNSVIKKKKTIRIFESREEEHPCTYILRDVTENSVNFDESQKHNVLN